MTFWNGVLWLHLLGMAFFVGGQLMLGAVVVPVLRVQADREPLRAAARRFGIGTVIAFAVLIVTGAAMAGHEHKWSDSTLQVKMGLVVLVGDPDRSAPAPARLARARRARSSWSRWPSCGSGSSWASSRLRARLVKHLSTFVIFDEVCVTMPLRPPAQGGLDRLHAGSAP